MVVVLSLAVALAGDSFSERYTCITEAGGSTFSARHVSARGDCPAKSEDQLGAEAARAEVDQLAALQVVETLDEKTGWRGVTWGARPAPELAVLAEEEAGAWLARMAGDDRAVGDVEVEQVKYFFTRGGLTAVSLATADPAVKRVLGEGLVAAYGPGVPVAGGTRWSGNRVRLDWQDVPGGAATITYTHIALAERYGGPVPGGGNAAARKAAGDL